MTKKQTSADSAPQQAGCTVEKYARSRHRVVIDPRGELVCLTAYKRGAVEVVRRLAA